MNIAQQTADHILYVFDLYLEDETKEMIVRDLLQRCHGHRQFRDILVAVQFQLIQRRPK